MLEQMRKLGAQTREMALAGFTEAEAEQLVDALARVRTNLSAQSERNTTDN
jgi:hypothetical protein